MQSSAMGSSCFLHSPFLPSTPSSSSSSALILSSRPLVLTLRNAGPKRKIRGPLMASVQPKLPPESCSAKRRVLIFLGVSVLPFLKWNHGPSVALAAGEDAVGTQTGIDEQALRRSPSPNPFVSFISAIGTLGSGILGALYAMARKDKIALVEKIDLLTNEMKEKDATIVSMKKNFEAKLLQEQEQGNKKLSEAKEEQFSLKNQLNSANSTIAGIERMLQSEKAKIKELGVQIDNLRSQLSKTEEDKLSVEEKLKEKNESVASLQDRIILLSSEIKDKEEAIQTLSSSLASKDADIKNLRAEYDKIRDGLALVKVENTDLKEELGKFRNELNQKDVSLGDLNVRLSSLVSDQDELRTSYNAVLKEYDELKTTSREKAASDAKLLEDKEREKNQLEEKYRLAMVQADEYQALISDLTRERDALQRNLDLEATNVNGLKRELELTQEALGESRNEASDLANQLALSKTSNSKLESELTRVQAEFSEARMSLEKTLEAEKIKSKELASELEYVKEAVDRTKGELLSTRQELTATAESRESLEKELIEVYQKAETATLSLQEEQAMVASLNAQLKSLEKQVTEDKASRKTLEASLDEATKALDEMNQGTMLLSGDLEMARAHISNLQGEKDLLTKVLDEREKLSMEARENLEDAQEVIKRLGSDRESLDRKVKELDAELASSKSEMLKLKAMVNPPKATVKNTNSKAVSRAEEAEAAQTTGASATAATTVKRVGRRKKAA